MKQVEQFSAILVGMSSFAGRALATRLKSLAMRQRTTLLIAFVALCSSVFATPSLAGHIPFSLDVDALWQPNSNQGYLNFVESGGVNVNHSPPSGTAEYTGWISDPAGTFGTDLATGARVDLLSGAAFDNRLTHGDRVDFDFVAENRIEENAPVSGIPVLDPLSRGWLTWEIAPTQASTHLDPATGLLHEHESESINLPDFTVFNQPTFVSVDVFSVIANNRNSSGVVTDPFGAGGLGIGSDSGGVGLVQRGLALDYVLDFCNINNGLCAPGVPVLVWERGWTDAAKSDDFVTRWVSTIGGATHVLIDPTAPIPTHQDQIIQIDAIVADPVPEPATLSLLAFGGLMLARRRRRSMQ